GLLGLIGAEILERITYFLLRLGGQNGWPGRCGRRGIGVGRERNGKVLALSGGHNLNVLRHSLISRGDDVQRITGGQEVCKLRDTAPEPADVCGRTCWIVEIDDGRSVQGRAVRHSHMHHQRAKGRRALRLLTGLASETGGRRRDRESGEDEKV